MIKKNYEAPEVEQMVIRFENNILSNVERVNVVDAQANGWSWDE